MTGDKHAFSLAENVVEIVSTVLRDYSHSEPYICAPPRPLAFPAKTVKEVWVPGPVGVSINYYTAYLETRYIDKTRLARQEAIC